MKRHHGLGEQESMEAAGLLDAARIDPLDIKGLFGCIWQGKWLISATTVIVVLLTGYYAFAVAQPRYAATVSVQLSQQNGDFTSPNLNSEIAVIRSRMLLEQVVRRLDLQEDPEFNRYLTPVSPWSPRGLRTEIRTILTGQTPVVPDDQSVNKKIFENLANAIRTDAQEESDVITITVTSRYDHKAIDIANAIAATYIEDQTRTAQTATESQLSWLSDKLFESQITLARKEAAITELISETRAADQATFDDLNRQALDTDKRLRDAQATLASLRDPDRADEQAPLSTNARRIEGQIAALEDVRANLRAQLAQQSASLTELNRLQREADASRVLYDTFLARLHDATLQGSIQNVTSRILSPAGPARYVGTRKTFLIGVGALLGVVLGTCCVFVRDAMRSGFRQPTALRDATGLPVLGQIPALRMRKPEQLLDRLSLPDTRAIQDATAMLRTALLVSSADEPPQTILCTSSVAGEDKTLLAITMAGAFANLDKSILLLDGDHRSRGINRYIPDTRSIDLTEMINGRIPLAHAVHHDPRWQADILAGNGHRSADIFCSAGFSNLMHRLREKYDHIIINAPPVLDTPDAPMLAQHAEAVIYAVRWNRTPLELIKAGQQALENVQAPITTLVLTQMDPKQRWAGVRRKPLSLAGLRA